MEIAAVGGKVISTYCAYNVVSLQLPATRSSRRRKNGIKARGRRAESYKERVTGEKKKMERSESKTKRRRTQNMVVE